MAISSTIKSIQDIMRKDAGTYGDAQRIEQLAWMFFLKIVDDRETEQELMDDDFSSPFPNKYRWRNWACLLYTSPSPRDRQKSRMPSSA